MFQQLNKQSIPWFTIAIIGIFIFSVSLRFWGLGRFNTLVFDEVYYAKFANNYLTRTPFFNAHPPLSQYIIAIGIWLGSHFPFGNDTVNGLTGSLRSPISYRWINALTGSFIPLVVAGIAYQLTHRRSYALIAALFTAADGLFLVESRYALNNIYLVILGLLGQWYFLLAVSNKGYKRWLWLAFAGVWFGASASIKWNGLWFMLGAYMLWGSAWLMRWARLANKGQDSAASHQDAQNATLSNKKMPWQNLTQLNLLHIIVNLGIIPVLIYSLIWIPHLKLNPTPDFWDMQNEILHYHERIGNGPKVHPYCSNWYTWPLMLRPIAYFYEKSRSATEMPPLLPPLPPGTGKVIFDVHAIGNPILWWLSTAAILILILQLAHTFLQGGGGKYPLKPSSWIGLYLIINYAANLLPWVRVTRCTFIYHYMGSSVFATLALAWIIDQWLQSPKPILKKTGITVIFLVLLAFVFWMPIYLGLPLDQQAYQIRMWLQSWI
ncbi:glycosyl transferase family 39 [Crinalium epipsammum PCC 9333]|uniref:Polyprenol-phosphate-mannose--protein mannosyltransferase n=1 Tax=Crinalium epipsammum PCC 9333 TaxID=1173022 RepID=K9W5C6_9CYAN|nr:phospholipid carrier-dependent glycosyltransferase [Crinalium epipsammum]AFZ15401.1 glycosyl transferase family 39 [Crinalium epipsammum PCC 9333]